LKELSLQLPKRE